MLGIALALLRKRIVDLGERNGMPVGRRTGNGLMICPLRAVFGSVFLDRNGRELAACALGIDRLSASAIESGFEGWENETNAARPYHYALGASLRPTHAEARGRR